jgi:uncharacterized protein (DUF433 family)
MEGVVAAARHIVVDARGEAWVADTGYRVADIAIDHLVHGFSPVEIRYQHYGELSLAQIHAALSFYYDHKAEMDKSMQAEADYVEEQRSRAGESPIVKKLRGLS